ncbi:MAG TPA: hypothetical protein VHE30_05860 [Polyangiaceae bacterium]|nr:hypothetical protein [Polyangiaceae bacterium]
MRPRPVSRVSGFVLAEGRGTTLAAAGAFTGAFVALSRAAFELAHPAIPLFGRFVLAVLLTALGLGGFVAAHAEPGAARLRRGARSAWPVLAVVALFPIVAVPFPSRGAEIAAALACLAALLHARRRGTPLSASRAFSLVTLSLALFVVSTYLAVGTTVTGSTNNDAAYYYGVARHIATTLRYEEPIVWQFLYHPKAVVHRPFDYWHGLASLTFVPVFRVFGSGPRVVGTFMALVSSSGVLLCWYVASIGAPLRSAWLQAMAVLLFSFSPALLGYRFDAETVPFAQAALLASLAAFSRKRANLALSFAFLAFFFRADTLSSLAIIALAVFSRELRRGVRAGVPALLTAGTFAAGYVGFHFLIFGTPTPPAASRAPFVTDGLELYRFRVAPPPRVALEQVVATSYLDGRALAAVETFARENFMAHPLLWLALGTALLFRPRTDHATARLAAALTVAGAFATSWTTTPVFASWRTLHPLLPAFVLAGSYGADALLAGLRPPRCRLRASAPVGAAFAAFMLFTTRPYERAVPESLDAVLVRRAAPALPKEGTVMAAHPWFVLAGTGLPSITVPMNGEDAMERAIATYDVRSLLLVNAEGCAEQSRAVCADIISGKRTRLGHYQLTRLRADKSITVVGLSR